MLLPQHRTCPDARNAQLNPSPEVMFSLAFLLSGSVWINQTHGRRPSRLHGNRIAEPNNREPRRTRPITFRVRGLG